MKQKIWLIAFFIIPAIFLVSCAKELDYRMAIPPIEFSIEGEDPLTATYKRNGDILKCHFQIDEEELPSDMTIKKVQLFLSNILIGETSEYSYIFEYQITDKIIGDHELKLIVVADGSHYFKTTNKIIKTIHIVETIPYYGFNFSHPETVQNGNEFQCSLSLNEKTTLDIVIDKVAFYLNDEAFETVSAPPFTIDKTFYFQEEGIHIIQAKIYYTLPSDGISGDITISDEINFKN